MQRLGEIPGSSKAAEAASPCPGCPVPVGAGHAAVESQFIDYPDKYHKINVFRIIYFYDSVFN